MKLSAKFKKNLWSGFRATLNVQLFNVALSSAPQNFLNFAESFIVACWLHFRNKKWGLPKSFLKYEQLKPKYGVFLQGFAVATVPFYNTKMTESFSAIIGVWYIRKFLSSVKTGLSHLRWPNYFIRLYSGEVFGVSCLGALVSKESEL